MERASKLSLSRKRPPAAGQPTQGAPDVAVVGYLRCNRKGRILSANATVAGWLGLKSPDALSGRRLASVLADESQWTAWRSLSGPLVCRFALEDREGGQKQVRAELKPGSAPGDIDMWMTEDVAGEMIARVAHLEAALTLTSGTVHDVNNVLTVLSGNLFLLTESLRDREDLYEQARRARNAAERGSTLLRELLTFNREQETATTSLCPGSHVLALEPLLLRTVRAAGADHELDVRVDEDAGSVVAGAAQFESVLINLVINARDALGKNGTVGIRVRNVQIADERAGELGVAAGDYVCVTVRDNGAGIPQDILPRVTEPLFSTKPKDRGSGLGLAMVRWFAESCRGILRIDSTEGRGTSVTLWLPRSLRLAETTANMTLPLSTLPGGEEMLLLLSRDRDVRTSLQQILETLGYTVLAAANIEAANRLLRTSPPPALILCERSPEASRVEGRWITSLKDAHTKLRHVALLQSRADAAAAAPDADGYVVRPVAVPELARTLRTVLEDH